MKQRLSLLLLSLFGALFLVTPALAASVEVSAVTATPSNTSVTVQWTTTVDSSSQVRYGLTSSYGSTTTETDTVTRVKQHSVTVTGLTACTTYHFQSVSNTLSYAGSSYVSDDIIATTAGCSVAAPAVSATAISDDDDLAETGPESLLYMAAALALFTLAYSALQLARQNR